MNSDNLVWSIVNNSFCSFKIKTKAGSFCKNEYNVTGLCNRHSCPLANSRYATIKERDGIIYLYMKEPERCPYPDKQWERVKLSKNNDKALEQIKKHLIYWNKWNISKVKARYDRTKAYLQRMRNIAKSRQKRIVPIFKKVERRELRREEKALRIAKISKSVENEILERIKGGIIDNKEIYNIDRKAFEEAIEKEKDLDEINTDEENYNEDSEEENIVYTDASDLESDIEDIEEYNVPSEESESEKELVLAGPSRKRKRIKITEENDNDQ